TGRLPARRISVQALRDTRPLEEIAHGRDVLSLHPEFSGGIRTCPGETGVMQIPNAENSEFDHAAFDPATRRVFIAHTARDCIEVIDHDAQRHIATLPGFPGVAGAVADDGAILTTNRGAAT